MDRVEYDAEMRKIRTEAEERRRTLLGNYAREKNPVNIGDYVQDHCCTIRVETMHVANYYDDPPGMEYFGLTCRTNGKDRGFEKQDYVFQCNLKKINGVKI